MRRLTAARDVKKNTENKNNDDDVEISVMKLPPKILEVYNNERVKRSIIIILFKKKVYKFESIK